MKNFKAVISIRLTIFINHWIEFRKPFKTVISLTLICAVVAILLGFTNGVTAPIIEEQEKKAVNEALAKVLPSGEDFRQMEKLPDGLPAAVTDVYSEKNGGYVFKMTTAGYGSGLVIMCGVDADGTVTGASCIASNETLGAEAEYGNTLVGAKSDSIGKLDTVAGATKTTSAYRGAVRDALTAFDVITAE